VHLPPHLSDQLATAVRPGDAVSVRGYRSPAAPLIVVTAVTDTSTNQTVVDQGPPPPGVRPPPLPPGVPSPGAQQASINGRLQTSLYGPAGDLNGAVLYDGTIVRMPPREAYQFASLLAPGQMVTVQGWALNASYGRVVDAWSVGPASAQMTTPPIAPFAPPPKCPPPKMNKMNQDESSGNFSAPPCFVGRPVASTAGRRVLWPPRWGGAYCLGRGSAPRGETVP
jgi:hypothetical protein